MDEESGNENIQGILTAMSHRLLFANPLRYLLELQNDKGIFIILVKHAHLDAFQNDLEIGSTYNVSGLTSSYIKYEDKDIQVWETSTLCRLFLLKKSIPLPMNLNLDSKMKTYKGKVTNIEPLVSIYELDGKLELCLAFVDMRSSCPRLSVGQEVTVYNVHIAEGMDNKKCLVVCGRGFVKVHSKKSDSTFDRNVPLAILVTRCKLGYADFHKLRSIIPVFEAKFSNDFIHKLEIQDPQMFRVELFVLTIKKIRNIEKYNMNEVMRREFMCLPHCCIANQKAALKLQMLTVKSCSAAESQYASTSTCWSFHATHGTSLLGYLSVSAQTGGWILSDASHAMDCIITAAISDLSQLQKMDRAFVLVKQYYIIMETFQEENIFEKKCYLQCSISDICLLENLSYYQNKFSVIASQTKVSSSPDQMAASERRNIDSTPILDKYSVIRTPSDQMHKPKCTCEDLMTLHHQTTVFPPIEKTIHENAFSSSVVVSNSCNCEQEHTSKNVIDKANVFRKHSKIEKQSVPIMTQHTELTDSAENVDPNNYKKINSTDEGSYVQPVIRPDKIHHNIDDNDDDSCDSEVALVSKIRIDDEIDDFTHTAGKKDCAETTDDFTHTAGKKDCAETTLQQSGSCTHEEGRGTIEDKCASVTSIQHKPQLSMWSSVEGIAQLTEVASTSSLNHNFHDGTWKLGCTSTKHKPPSMNISSFKTSFHFNSSVVEQSVMSSKNFDNDNSCYSQTILLHQKSSVMKESKNSPPQCCLLVSLVGNVCQELDNESPKNQSDARRYVLVIKGPLLKKIPFLLMGYMYTLTLPSGCHLNNLFKVSSWTCRQCSVVAHSRAVYLPRGSQLSMLQPCSLMLRYIQDIISVACVKDSSHSEILNLNGLIYDCLHITPKFSSELRSLDVTGFGVPGMKTVVLKLKDSTASNDTICLYLCKWAHNRYPLGMVVGAYICATFVKKVISRNTYLLSTELTNIEILSYSTSAPILNNILDEDFKNVFYSGQDLSPLSVVWYMLCPVVLKVSLRPICSNCQSRVEDNSCSYKGCFALDSSIVKVNASCFDKGLLGQVIIYFKDDHVRELLGIPEKVWHQLIQIVKRGNEITSFKQNPQKQKSTSLAEKVLQQYCNIVPMQHRMYVQCRMMKANTLGEDKDPADAEKEITKLFCLKIHKTKLQISALMCEALSIGC